VVASVRAVGHEDGTIEVVCRGPDPARNASMLRALLRQFVGEDEREQEEKARADLKCYRDKLAQVNTALAVIDNEIREFNTAYPWLLDDLSELEADLSDAEAEVQRAPSEVRAMDARKRASELRDRLCAAPELLAARSRLQEDRYSVAVLAADYRAGIRSIDAGPWPCRLRPHRAAFRVAEWPRPDPTPATPLRDEAVRTQGIALILALAFLLVLSPAWFHILLGARLT
jgi:hypothetical protein